MTTIMPEGEAIRKAIQWVSAELQTNPKVPVQELVNKAVFLFDLSPKDSDFLIRFFRDAHAKAPSGS